MYNRIIFFLILFQFSAKIMAQDSTQHVHVTELGEVVVSAGFQETEIRKAARNITVITAQQIALAPAKTLDGILQYALNVDVRSRAPWGVQADVSLRGGHFDQTLILIDGVKLNDPQTGHHSMNLPISIDQIERIEILQGGASRVYGPSAFAGLIHIISKKHAATGGSLGIAYGNHGLLKLNAAAQLSGSKASASLSAERMSSSGYAYNTAFEKQNLFFNSSLNLSSAASLQLQGGLFANNFGASNFYAPKVYEQYEEVAAKLLAVKYLHSFSDAFKSNFTASYRRHTDFYDFNNFRKTAPISVNIHQTNVYDASWIGKYTSRLGTTTLGLEWRREGVISNRLGEVLSIKKTGPKIDSTQLFYTKAKNRDNTSVYVEQWKQLGAATITAGLLYNVSSQFGGAVFPGLDVSLLVNNHNSLYMSANRSLRYPTFTEMYLTGSTVVGNPNLQPEDAWLVETGLKHLSGKVAGGLTVFYRYSNNTIDKLKRPEKPIPTMESIGNMASYGLEMSAKLNIPQLCPKTKIWQSISANYAYTFTDKKEAGYQSFYTLNYLRHKASLGANLLLAKHVTLDVWYTYKQRLGTYQWDATSPEQPYKAVKLTDLRLQWQATGLRIFADVNNLFANKYYEFGFVQQPGRWASVGFMYNFQKNK
jgi:vitamin B12 transporter